MGPLIGRVIRTKTAKTAMVQVARRIMHPLYGKEFIKRRKFMIHDAEEKCSVGDVVQRVCAWPLRFPMPAFFSGWGCCARPPRGSCLPPAERAVWPLLTNRCPFCATTRRIQYAGRKISKHKSWELLHILHKEPHPTVEIPDQWKTRAARKKA